MITGQVSHLLEAVIPLTILGSDLQPHVINAVIDTGFSGYLTLPSMLIKVLKLEYADDQIFFLGNNEEVKFELYEATVLWDGMERDILVVATDTEPLIGMSSLKGNLIFIDAIDGGEIRIEQRPAKA